MNYREALAWLFGTQLFGIKPGLENIQRLLAAFEIPSPDQRIIHVAGTNGKGSVCAMIDAICRAQGYNTGLFTSPHLVTFRERVRVSGEMISEGEVVHGLTSIRELICDWEPHPTFFEIATALGLLQFHAKNCEIVVLETGMGGRLDATNAVLPVVSVITPIDYDHQKWLGNTLEEIAAEKAGIIKPGVPVVSAPQSAAAAAVIRATAARVNKERRRPPGRPREEEATRRAPLLEFVADRYQATPIGLPGAHQRVNAAVAIAALHAAEIEIDERAIAAGLTSVQWPARFQRWDDRTTIDGAHNPSSARMLVKTWRETFGDEKAVLVFGVFQDKQIREIFSALSDIAQSVHLPAFHGARVAAPVEVAAIVHEFAPAKPVSIHETCGQAIEAARRTGARVLIAGSLHLAGEALAYLQGAPGAFEECDQ